MDKQQIIELLNVGENCEIEFKEAKKKLPKSLWSTYSAFTNSKGGIIVLGIIENKNTGECTLEGLENTSDILKDFWNTINNKEKISVNILDDEHIETTIVEEKTIIIINIPKANRQNKPVYINNNPITGTFKRYHDGDYKCLKEEIRVMFSESTDKSKDEMILEEYNINNIDKETFESYRRRFKLHKGDNHEWNNLSDKEFLYMIRALDRKTNKLTLAGLLMFGKIQDIIEVRPNYFLDYREINDIAITERWSHRITSSADEGWAGNLWGFFNKIVNRLTADIETPFALDRDMMRIADTDVHKSVRERTC